VDASCTVEHAYVFSQDVVAAAYAGMVNMPAMYVY